ncbi:xyloglucan galactosyltransferase XLT2-like [Coffea arabica]|uniref:Xyloglucan galactosyltransferase XLT2-like n=1 Tax=Coffea arabica TaxID=13443 RepID=A0ABM4UAV6_COFAR
MPPTFSSQRSSPPPPPPQHHYSPKKTKPSLLKTTFNSIKSQPGFRLTGWLVITLIFQALIIVFFLQDSSSAPAPSRLQSFQAPTDKECKFGRIYVYDLPPEFNADLLKNCNDLDPWKSRCNAVSNGGFGPKATNLGSVVPENLLPAWYWTDMYIGEVIYHVRVMDYKCRTLDPLQATAFYVPFYPGLAVGKYLWFNYTSKDRDRPSEMLLDWLTKQPYWKKSNGADHVFAFGRLTWDFRRQTDKDTDWGTSFIYMPLMKNVIKITVERSPWDELEFSVPYPTSFHPRSESDIVQWQSYIRSRTRHSLFTFVGATRTKIKNDFRGLLMDYCKSESGSCRVVDCSVTRCSDGATAILEAFLDSDFCLQPKGDGSTRRSFFDCMLAGSIPVYFWEGSFQGQYEWHLPINAKTYSVFINHNDVRNGENGTVRIRKVLEGYTKDEVKKMRETIVDLLPRLLYAESSKGLGNNTKDAFDVTMERVLRRIQLQNLRKKQNF